MNKTFLAIATVAMLTLFTSAYYSAYNHVSVNMDRSISVFNTIVALDNLDRSAQFCTSADAQETISKSWRLDEGYHSFMIDKNGKIVAVDPDADLLAKVK